MPHQRNRPQQAPPGSFFLPTSLTNISGPGNVPTPGGFEEINIDQLLADLIGGTNLPQEALSRGGLFSSLFQAPTQEGGPSLPLTTQFPLGELPPPLSFTPQLNIGIQRQQQLQSLPVADLVDLIRSGTLSETTGLIPQAALPGGGAAGAATPQSSAGIQQRINALQGQIQALQAQLAAQTAG